jgi:hypothetical protein
VQTKIDLDLFLGGSPSPLPVVNLRERNVRLRVFVIQAYRLQQFSNSSVELALLLKHVAQAVVCRSKLRIEPESFP